MKTIDEIIEDHVIQWSETDCVEKEWAIACMKQYAVEAINELIDEMLAYPPNELSESANLIQIANRIKREIHGVVITQKSDGNDDTGNNK